MSVCKKYKIAAKINLKPDKIVMIITVAMFLWNEQYVVADPLKHYILHRNENVYVNLPVGLFVKRSLYVEIL